MCDCLKAQDWPAAQQIVWDEFMDMHHLFETASKPFSYLNDTNRQVLSYFEKYWESEGDGPLITMDAGPNIHLLFRQDQQELAERTKRDFLINYDVI